MIAATVAAAVPAATAIIDAVAWLFQVGRDIRDVRKDIQDTTKNSLTAHTRMTRLTSRVYIDGSVAVDGVITDILKTVHVQYAALILNALQLQQFVSKGVSVQDFLHVVASEDMRVPFRSVIEAFGQDVDRDHAGRYANTATLSVEAHDHTPMGEIVELRGDGHTPAGKMLKVALTNPDHPEVSIDINLFVQLAPYIIPQLIAVKFITKDVMASTYQRYLQWRTGEISFWKDFVFQTDVVHNRARLLKLDTTGVLADMMQKQQASRHRTLANLADEQAGRARNIANSVLVFSSETLVRAKAESGIDLTDVSTRESYFASTFAMIIVVVDSLYNQVTFYYNGIIEAATFSFDQMHMASKGGQGLDLVSVLNALSQGKSPKF